MADEEIGMQQYVTEVDCLYYIIKGFESRSAVHIPGNLNLVADRKKQKETQDYTITSRHTINNE